MSYSSPFLTTLGGVEQVVILGNDRLAGVSSSDGKLLWTFEGWQAKRNIPAPTPVGDGRIFVTCGYGVGSVMIRVTCSGGKFQTEELFRTGEVGAQLHRPLLFKGYLYVGNNSNSRRDGLTCFTLDGKVKWQTKRAPNIERGPLILADGMIYALDGATGILHLVEANPDGYKELAQARIFQSKMVWATLAMTADGKLLLRDRAELKCLDVKNP